MRYLIFGDVHGNLIALEKIFILEKNNYDQIICHGDVVNYGPWDNECVELLNTFNEIILLTGNHETNYILGYYNGQNLIAQTFFDFCYPHFRCNAKIKKYKDSYNLGPFKIVHSINEKYIYPDTDLTQIKIP